MRDHILFGLRVECAAGFFGRCSSKPIARYGDSVGRRREGQVPPHGACHNLFMPRAARSAPPSHFFSSFLFLVPSSLSSRGASRQFKLRLWTKKKSILRG